jgi:flagellar basal body-associated protein FliL
MANDESKTQKGKKSNTGMIMLIVTMVILALVILYFVFFDKKVNRVSSVRNTPLTSGNRIPLLNANSPINSAAISLNGGYGGKFNKNL